MRRFAVAANWTFRLAAIVVAVSQIAQAEVRLPALFSDHMVLQQGEAVAVWGWADAGETVTVSVAGQKRTGKAGADGRWRIKLHRLKAGGPHTLTVSGKNSVVINDVLVGEVWLGSGQSNMAMAVSRAKDFEAERANSNLPQIRMFKVESGGAAEAQEDCKGNWQVCSPETVGAFSATLFFCGREIHRSLNVPVGLVNSSVGGTPIESWISPEAQRAATGLKPYLDNVTSRGATNSNARAGARNPRVGGLFNGKIAPLIPYTIRGAVWYQGEANAASAFGAKFYEQQLPLLVEDWRRRWGRELPFAWVQLPNFAGRTEGWCLVREAMLKTLKLPRTGMAITTDIGEAKDIHPKNKQEVGRRLALWALGEVYGEQVPATSGPLLTGHKIRGGEVVLTFEHANGGLVARDGELRGFEISGADQQWKPGYARIEGRRVIVSSADAPSPVAVRFAWRDDPDGNLFNGAGLPASPFRTSQW